MIWGMRSDVFRHEESFGNTPGAPNKLIFDISFGNQLWYFLHFLIFLRKIVTARRSLQQMIWKRLAQAPEHVFFARHRATFRTPYTHWSSVVSIFRPPIIRTVSALPAYPTTGGSRTMGPHTQRMLRLFTVRSVISSLFGVLYLIFSVVFFRWFCCLSYVSSLQCQAYAEV